MKTLRHAASPAWRHGLLMLGAGLVISLAGCAPTGGSSMLPSFTNGFSLSPNVNVARNMKGRSIDDAITAMGEPSRTRQVGNDVMELEWSDYQTAPYTEWVSTGSSQQVVGMIPGTNTSAPTPVFQTTNHGYMDSRTRVYECSVKMRMQNSIIIDTQVDGNVCPEFISALRGWAGEKEDRNYKN